MTDTLLFILGCFITAITLSAVLLVGKAEADDPALNRGKGVTDGR